MSYTINNLINKKKYVFLNKVLDFALEYLQVESAIFSVILVDDDTILGLNRDYRNKDKVTDVISFAFEDFDDVKLKSIRVLGDIYICIPQMERQAISYGHDQERELSFLAIHGLLHLLGYDHMEKDDEIIMFELQDKILEGVNL